MFWLSSELHQGSGLQRELAPREAANLQNKGELDPVGQFWSGWLGAEACGAEITSG